jgi:uncharacterized membrane protein
MSDVTQPTPPSSPPPPTSASSDERQMALIIYILYLVACASGITAVVGVVMAYVSRSTAPDWLKSHYTFQIRTFWMGLLYFTVSAALCVILIGVPLLIASFIWYIVRCAMGLSRLLRNEPYPTPESWTV